MFFLKHLVIALIGLLVCSNAFAQEQFRRPITEWKNLDAATQARLEPFKKASFSLDLVRGGVCSGTFISNEGHILTAFHCIDRILRQEFFKLSQEPNFSIYWGIKTQQFLFRSDLREYLESQPEAFSMANVSFYPEAQVYGLQLNEVDGPRVSQILKIKNENPKLDTEMSIRSHPDQFRGLSFEVLIDGKKKNVRFLGSGNGDMFPFFHPYQSEKWRTPEYDHLWRVMNRLGYGTASDFAVLKIDEETPCIPLRSEELTENEEAFILSRPQLERFVSAEDRQGEGVFYSEGKARLDVPEFFPQEETHRLEEGSPFLHSEALTTDGGSGSALISARTGEVLGLVFMANVAETAEASTVVATKVIKASFLKEVLKNRWGISDLSCVRK